MRDRQGLTWITTAVLERMADVYADLRPERVLVQARYRHDVRSFASRFLCEGSRWACRGWAADRQCSFPLGQRR